MKRLAIILLIAGFFSCNCNNSNSKTQQPSNSPQKRFQNITILLDLSDRIKNGDSQAERDKELIEMIVNLFEKRQKLFGYIASRDKLSFAIASQRESELNLFKHKDALVIDMGERGMNKPKFDIEKSKFLESVNQIYEDAVNSKTTGADIWTFFRDNAKNYVKPSSGRVAFSNKMFILSDGYLVFDKEIARKRRKRTYMSLYEINSLRNKGDWEHQFERQKLHLIPHQNINFENLQVLMLGVKPVEPELNTNEFQIIEKYWESWFDEMGIESNIFPFEDNAEITAEIISKFYKKKASTNQ